MIASLPSDPALLAALEYQYAELDAIRSGIEWLRTGAVPMAPASWSGRARGMFDLLVRGLEASLDSAEDAVHSAAELTSAARREVAARA